MKKRLLLIFAPVIMMLVLVASCSKGGGGTLDPGTDDPHYYSPNDTTNPVVEIYTPLPNQVFSSGAAIDITGRLTDDLGLYRGSIRVTDDATGVVVKEQLYEIHFLLLYNFNISFTPLVTATSNYTVTVNFEDHGFNTATRSVKVKVNP